MTDTINAVHDRWGNRNIQGVSIETGLTENVNSVNGNLTIANKVYDPDTDTWIPMTQDSSSVEKLLDDYYKDIRYDYSGLFPLYVGYNTLTDADTSTSDWVLVKNTYSGINIVRKQYTSGAWDDRVSLF